MSQKAEALRTAIAVLTAQLAIEEGKPATAYLPGFDAAEAERKRLEEIANSMKPHEWRDWSHDNPLPEHVGNNERESPLWERAKPFWTQMERQLPPVLDSRGVRFNALTCAKRGGWGDFEDEVRRLWEGPEGVAYRADPANAAIWPNIRV